MSHSFVFRRLPADFTPVMAKPAPGNTFCAGQLMQTTAGDKPNRTHEELPSIPRLIVERYTAETRAAV
jgi:hypothetical protein